MKLNKAGKITIKIIISIFFAIYAVLLLSVLFFKYHGGGFLLNSSVELNKYIKLNTNFIPFKTIGEYIGALINNSTNPRIIVANLVGNVIIFIPMGIFLPFYFKKLRVFGKYIITVVIMVLLVELIQFVFMLGIADIDDFILNVAGGAIGFVLWKIKPVQWVVGKIAV